MSALQLAVMSDIIIVRRKPAKRAKMKRGEGAPSKKATAKRRGKQGRLSVLPTLPMDLL